jgi:hypothetical protein
MADIEIPENLRAFGAPQQIYAPRAGAGAAGFYAVAVVMAALCLGASVGIFNPPAQNPPPPEIFIGLVTVFGLCAFASLWKALYAETYVLAVYPEGLARIGAGKGEMFLWSDIGEVYDLVHPLSGKTTLIAKDGRELFIDASFRHRQELDEHVRKTLLEQMLPQKRRLLEAGEALVFGPLRLDKAALHYQGKSIGWERIARLGFGYNALSRCVQLDVVERGALLLPWCVVRAHDIPNMDVFNALAQEALAPYSAAA